MPALALLVQPESTFYKEEGGRSNTLSLCVSAPADAPFPQFGPVRLSLQLCYENRNLCVPLPLHPSPAPRLPPPCSPTLSAPLSALPQFPQGGGRPQHPQGRFHLAHL